MRVTKEFRTETAHRLKDHPGRCQNLHGHSYKWQITLYTPQLNLQGMVEDFGDMKKKIGSIIDKYDHAVVLQDDDEWVDIIVRFSSSQRVVIYKEPPTVEAMCYVTRYEIQAIYPECDVTVRIYETATSWAEI